MYVKILSQSCMKLNDFSVLVIDLLIELIGLMLLCLIIYVNVSV